MQNMNIINDDFFHPSFPKQIQQKSAKLKIGQFFKSPSLSVLQEIIYICQTNTNSTQQQKLYQLIEQMDKINAQGLQNFVLKVVDGTLESVKDTLQSFIKIGLLYYTLIHLKSYSLIQVLFAKGQKNINGKKQEETQDSIQQGQTSIYLIKKTYQIFGQSQQLLIRIIDILRREKKELLLQGLQFYHFVCNNEDSKFSYGKALVQMGKVEEGILYLTQIEESSSKVSLQSMEIIAYNFKKLKMFGDSIQYYQKILQHDSFQSELYTLATFQIGNILKSLDFLQQSLFFLQKSIVANKLRTPKERNIGYKAIMDIIQIFQSQNHPIPVQLIEAISNLSQITSREKLQAYLCFARSKFHQNHISLIGSKLDKIVYSQNLTNELKLLAGKTYLLIGYYNKAKQLLQDNSQSYEYHINLSYMNRKQGFMTQGRMNFQNAISINQYQTLKNENFFQLFNSYYKKQDIKNQLYAQFQSNMKQICDEYYKKGLEYKNQKKYFQSLREFKMIRVMDEKRSDYLMDVIEIFIFCQRFNDAFKLLEEIFKNGQKNIVILEKIHEIYIGTNNSELKKQILSKYSFVTQRKSQVSMKESKQFKLHNFQIKLKKLNFISFKVNPLWQTIKVKLALSYKDAKQIDKILNKSYKQFYLDCSSLKILAKMCIQKGVNKYSQRFLSRALKIQLFDDQIVDLYITYLESKKDFSVNDLQSFKKYTAAVKLKNHIKVKIAQLYLSVKKTKQAMKIIIQIIEVIPTYQFYSIFENILKQLKYSEEDALKTILKYNNNIHQIHQRLASIYRVKCDANLEIYHQQQIVKLFWNKQRALDRLVQLYKVANRDEEYISCMKELSYLRVDDSELRLKLAQQLRKRRRYKEEIVVLMRELKDKPLDVAVYKLISLAFQSYLTTKQSNEDNFAIIDIFHADERPLYYFQISLYYRYLKQFEESMNFFKLAMKDIFLQRIHPYSLKQRQIIWNSLKELEKQYGCNNIDIIIKKAIFSKYSQNDEDYSYSSERIIDYVIK